ncbi:MAG: methyltransferase domain-containing protein [Hyphomicrobiaceae bacterium]
MPFYKNHWVNIEAERLERYQSMFSWTPASKPLYALADIQEGQVVADFGCGPGCTAIEIARWVGESGHVHALDINEHFVNQCQQHARDAGFQEMITPHLSDGTSIPLPGGSVDRISTRNTLIYVDDPVATVIEFQRVVRDGGKVHAIEGDWPMMVAEPISSKRWTALVEAASYACRTPDIGRRLPGLLSHVGFTNIELEVVTRPDLDGRLMPMIRNLARYARTSAEMDVAEIDDIVQTLERALTDGTYLVLAPQFVVAATK